MYADLKDVPHRQDMILNLRSYAPKDTHLILSRGLELYQRQSR